jgi:tetratricopeptide (TPR) repeat protein
VGLPSNLRRPGRRFNHSGVKGGYNRRYPGNVAPYTGDVILTHPERVALDRLGRSAAFESAPRLRALLVYLCTRETATLSRPPKETVVGVEFFGRSADYDPRKDPIVRVEAYRLRARLLDYYSQEGANEPLRLELPKGTYVPVFRDRHTATAAWRLAVVVEAEGDLKAEGLTAELIGQLGSLPGVCVLAPRSSLAAQGGQEAIDRLGANLVLECRLEGSVLRAKLSQATAGGLKPMATFDNAIQLNVEALGAFVATKIGVAGREASKRRAIDRESYERFLAGRAWFHRWSNDNLAQAAMYFEQVTEKCPDYAPAFAGLADVQVLLAYWHSPNAKPVLEKGLAIASRAVKLDPGSSEACCSMAAIETMVNRNWSASEALFRRSLEINPNNALALNWLAIINLIPRGRFEEAIDAAFSALELDPASPEIGNEIVWVYLCSQRYEEAVEQGRRIIALHPNFLEAYWSLSLAESASGRPDQALEILDQAESLVRGVAFTLALRVFVEGMHGRIERATEHLRQLHALADSVALRDLYFVWAYGGIGDVEKAMQYLRRAMDANDPLTLYIKVFYPFTPVRSHPEFGELLQRQRLAGSLAKIEG